MRTRTYYDGYLMPLRTELVVTFFLLVIGLPTVRWLLSNCRDGSLLGAIISWSPLLPALPFISVVVKYYEQWKKDPNRGIQRSFGIRRGATPTMQRVAAISFPFSSSDASVIFEAISDLNLNKADLGRLAAASEASRFRRTLTITDAEGEKTVLGISRYGKGRVILATHESLGRHPQILGPCLGWLGVHKGTTVWAASCYVDEIKREVHNLSADVIVQRTCDTWWETPVGHEDTIILQGDSNDYKPQGQEMPMIQDWVNQGGRMIIGTTTWVAPEYLKVPRNEYPFEWVNLLVRSLGAKYETGHVGKSESGSVYSENGNKVRTIGLRW